MIRRLPQNLYSLLIGLLLFGILPLFILCLFLSLETKRMEEEHAQADTVYLIRRLARHTEECIDGVRHMLIGASELHSIKESKSPACMNTLSGLLQKDPLLMGIAIAQTDGKITCSTTPQSPGLDISDRQWFKRAIDTGRFTIGAFQMGRVTDKAGLALALPFSSSENKVHAVIAAIIDVAQLNESFQKVKLPEGAVLTLLDRNGVVLARSPFLPELVGKSPRIPPEPGRLAGLQDEGVCEISTTGGKRLCAFYRPFAGIESGLLLILELPPKSGMGTIGGIDSEIILFLTLLFALSTIGFGIRLLFISPIRAMLQAAEARFSGGICVYRADRGKDGELGRLAAVLNLMTDSAEELNARLRRAETNHRRLMEEIPAVIYTATAFEKSSVTYMSPRVTALLGYTPEQFFTFPALWTERLHSADRKRISSELTRCEIEGTPFRSEYRMLTKDGATVWVRDDASPVRNDAGEILFIQGMIRDITERKTAETALMENEAKFRNIIETLPVPVIVCENLQVVYANAAAKTLTGYRGESLVGMNHRDLFDPERQSAMEDAEARLCIGKAGPLRFETQILTRSGEKRRIDITAIDLRPHGSDATLLAAVDVTERLAAVERMSELNRRQDLILNAVSEGIFGIDPRGIITFINPAAVAMLGWSYEDLKDLPLHSIFQRSPETGQVCSSTTCPICRTVADGIPRHGRDLTFYHKNGSALRIEYTCSPLLDAAGTQTGSVVTFRDISSLIETENELSRLTTAFRYTGDAVAVTDPDGFILQVNPAFEKLTGRNAANISGLNIQGIGTGNNGNPSFRPDSETEPVRGRFTIRHKNGELVETETIVAPVRNAAGPAVGMVVLMRDTGIEAKLEQRLRTAQKMEAMGTLAGGIAHDFNNILGAILGYSEMALDKLPEDSPVRRHLQQVFKAGNRAKELVRQILSFSRETEREHHPVRIGQILKETLKLLRASLPSNIEIRQNIFTREGQDRVLSDPTLIHQVMMNLCTNAAHAMREKGGVLEVTLTEAVSTERFREKHPEAVVGPFLLLSVSDTGCGIDPSVLDRIFDPLFTTKSALEGTGFGLSVVRSIVESHKGVVEVLSEPAKGTTFHVYWPKMEEDRSTEKEEPPSPPPAPGNEHILMVDDEPALVQMWEERLSRLGYNVTVMNDGIEALDIFKRNPDAFNLVVTDQTMPRMTGIELSAEIMRIRPSMPIILCTGYSETVTPQDAETVGIREFLLKPLVLSDLVKAIRRVMDTDENA